jgi:phosphoserine phosphatase
LSLKAVFFDLDGTLKLYRDPYQYIHAHLGFGEQTRQLFEMYQRGEIDSDEWIRRDVAVWRGLSRSQLVEWLGRIPYTPGAKELARTLRARGVITAVISTGLQLHADMVKADLQLDYAMANQVVFENDLATGEVIIRVHESEKASIVQKIMGQENVLRDECLAVGDGESDIGMFKICRIGVAVRPMSERVRQSAHIVLEEARLDGLLLAVWGLVPEWQNAWLNG